MRNALLTSISGDAEFGWGGINRRKEKRWYLPYGAMKVDIEFAGRTGELMVTNLSLGGLGGQTTDFNLREGAAVRLHPTVEGAVFDAKVERLDFSRVGLSATDRQALTCMIDLARLGRATQLHHGRDGEIVVEGFLGIGAHSEMRRALKFKVIDLARVSGMDRFGLGILYAHQEQGCKIAGCRGQIRHLLQCANFCKNCLPHNPTNDCPRFEFAANAQKQSERRAR